MSNSTNPAMVTIPWLHFGNADCLLFKTWCPSSHGSIAGACVGLFLFCIMERCLAAYRRNKELRWRAKTSLMSIRVPSNSGKQDITESSAEVSITPRRRFVPPFILSHDIPRGAIQVIQSTFAYALMLTVMTFNAAYILSILVGLGVGEVLFGRIGQKNTSVSRDPTKIG